MNIGKDIKEYIKQHGLKQSYVAERCGINKDTFSRLLNGKKKFTLEEYEMICIKGLQVSPAYFYKEV